MNGQQVWMFSGQGSQYYQMGLDLYEADEVFRATMDWCGEQVSEVLDEPLTSLLFRARPDKFAPFDRTLHTHLALFSVQLSMARTLLGRGHRPDAIVGYSLGDWVGHVVAGRVPAEAVLDLLARQGRQAEAVCERGGMLAVFAPWEIVDLRPDWFGETWVAARNFDGHFVVSGLRESIEAVERRLKEQNITSQILPVSHAFHTPMMDALREDCLAGLKALAFRPASTRLWSARGEEVTHAEPVNTLWRAVREAVELGEAVAAIEAEGKPVYVDCGPSGTLANFVKYNLPRGQQSRCVVLMTQFGKNIARVDSFGAACAAAGGMA
jgi:acyl transferase domain-containing protein